METKSLNRVYRQLQPSDLPQVQAGTLKAFYKWYDHVYPATLVSVRGNAVRGNTIWLIPANIHNLNDKAQDSIEYGYNNIFVDVTPEKRYAVWNHKAQRFAWFSGKLAVCFNSRVEAELAIKEMFPEGYPKNFYVVEWEIKSND